ncbi:MAG TPA: ketopantoate reductase family protein [Candidatus Acidoferrales bacterium]|nr:ketopantoate reductase family protein [Candidatus Acidoferrales bacterium]
MKARADGPILVAGAGAIGSVVGGMLHAAGHRVTMLGRRGHLEAIARDGLRITGLLGEQLVRGLDLADNPARLRARFALILVTVKSYDTAELAGAISDRLADDGLVVSLQNGLGNIELLAERFSLARVIGGRVIFGAEITRPGATHVTVFADPVAIGPDPQQHRELSARLEQRAQSVAAMLSAAGVPTVAVSDVMPVIWTKLIYNAALNALGALHEMSYGELAADRDLAAIMDEVIGEAFAVASRSGVRLPYADAGAYREMFYGRLIPSTASHRPTMLFDLKNRGRTDIDSLNGRIVELGERFGVDTPANRMLTRMIHDAERGRATSRAVGK